jgi:hypothetical protein
MRRIRFTQTLESSNCVKYARQRFGPKITQSGSCGGYGVCRTASFKGERNRINLPYMESWSTYFDASNDALGEWIKGGQRISHGGFSCSNAARACAMTGTGQAWKNGLDKTGPSYVLAQRWDFSSQLQAA